MTARQIDDATGTAMGSHYTTHPTQPAIMTREHLDAVRNLIGEVPEWVEREADIRSVESKNFAEREVVSQQEMRDTSEVRIAVTANADQYDAGARRVVNITAPATPEARQWQGWGTALKPALEPITVARKPLGEKTVAANVLEHGTGAINVDGCRVGTDEMTEGRAKQAGSATWNGADRSGGKGSGFRSEMPENPATHTGRWPANLIHDGSDEVAGLFPDANGSKGSGLTQTKARSWANNSTAGINRVGHNDTGSAARFFYCAKASKKDRDEGCEGMEEQSTCEHSERMGQNNSPTRPDGSNRSPSKSKNFHPTVKPTDLMRYLCRLVTPPSGIVLDPFMGSGSTGKAAVLEGFRFVGIEREEEYLEIATSRMAAASPLSGLQTA
jgi:site-specific DNA-methyltransferase (adenine-specific)